MDDCRARPVVQDVDLLVCTHQLDHKLICIRQTDIVQSQIQRCQSWNVVNSFCIYIFPQVRSTTVSYTNAIT